MVELTSGGRTRRVLARNPAEARPGDTVTVRTEPERILLSVLVLYLLPLAAFAAGYTLGGSSLWGVAAVVPAGALAYVYNRRVSGNGFLSAVILPEQVS